jgi:hypothetical protein
MRHQRDVEHVTIRFGGVDRNARPKGKERINVVYKNADFLDVFARTNIINQIGDPVSVFPGIL